MEPWHDKKSFFKYYDAESVILTLKETTRKWSAPFVFNDPFDNQFDLNFEQPSEQLAREQAKLFFERLSVRKPFAPYQFGQLTPKLEVLRQLYANKPNFKHSEDDMSSLVESMLEGMQNAFSRAPEANKEIRSLMADTSIFCLSETCDNLLMWAHYAHSHTGAVVEFLSLQEVDSPLIIAQPVNYTQNMPRMNFEALQEVQTMTRQSLDMLSLTKSKAWEYEEEWRIVTTMRDKSQSFEILPYAPEEVGAVYLGCNMIEENKNNLKLIIKDKYPDAKIYQANKHDSKFKLVFERVI